MFIIASLIPAPPSAFQCCSQKGLGTNEAHLYNSFITLDYVYCLILSFLVQLWVGQKCNIVERICYVSRCLWRKRLFVNCWSWHWGRPVGRSMWVLGSVSFRKRTPCCADQDSCKQLHGYIAYVCTATWLNVNSACLTSHLSPIHHHHWSTKIDVIVSQRKRSEGRRGGGEEKGEVTFA